MSGELFALIVIIVGITGTMLLMQYQKIRTLQARIQNLEAKSKPLQVSRPTAADLESKLKTAYENKIAESASTFQKNLADTSKALSEQLSHMTTTVIEEELGAYKKTLEKFQASANAAAEQIQETIEQQRAKVTQEATVALTDKKQSLISTFETKMGDVVAGYIVESLGGGVDLGAQMDYVLASLDKHKDDIKKDLLDAL